MSHPARESVPDDESPGADASQAQQSAAPNLLLSPHVQTALVPALCPLAFAGIDLVRGEWPSTIVHRVETTTPQCALNSAYGFDILGVKELGPAAFEAAAEKGAR